MLHFDVSFDDYATAAPLLYSRAEKNEMKGEKVFYVIQFPPWPVGGSTRAQQDR